MVSESSTTIMRRSTVETAAFLDGWFMAKGNKDTRDPYAAISSDSSSVSVKD
jgi:hypothetical protein